MEWISVKDELPERARGVLVYMLDERYHQVQLIKWIPTETTTTKG